MIRIGLVGVNTSHAGVFAGLFNGGRNQAARLEGARVVAVWGEPCEDARAIAAMHGIEQVVDDPAAMIGQIDGVLVVDDTGGGASHARLARPFIQAGIPTFIDKPMTLEIADAVALFDLAQQHNTPLMSSSALRYAAEIVELRRQLATMGRISSIISVGPGDWYYYGVHAVEMLLTVVGKRADWVQRFAEPERDIVVVGFKNGPSAVVETLRDARYVFQLIAYAAEGWAACTVVDADVFYANLMAATLEMFRSRVAPVSPAETLAVLAILDGGRASASTGGRVWLDDLLPGRARAGS